MSHRTLRQPSAGRATRARGFTLLEVLVAIAIFAFVGVMALSGYTQLQKQTEYQQLRLERVREVQRAVQTLAQDLTQIEQVRKKLAEADPAIQISFVEQRNLAV